MTRTLLLASLLFSGCVDTEDIEDGEVAQYIIPGHELVSEPSGFHSTWWRSPTTSCSAGNVLYGVGADHTRNTHILFRGVAPLVSGTQAEAGAHEDQAGTTSNWRLTAYGVCGQPMPGHQVVWRGSDWGSLETRNASVSCPEGLVVIGAGARIRGADGRVKVDEIRPGYLLRSVEVHASEDEVGTSSNWDVLAYAICAVRPSGHQLVEASVDRGWLAATPAVAACPQGKKLLSAFGGVKAFDTKNLRVSRMMPTGNLRAATVIASTTGGSTRGDVNAYAICMDE